MLKGHGYGPQYLRMDLLHRRYFRASFRTMVQAEGDPPEREGPEGERDPTRGPGRPRVRDLSPFGRRLRQLIAESERFASREAFLRELGIAPATLYRYETEDRLPRLDVLRRMAELLGVSVDMLGGADPYVSPVLTHLLGLAYAVFRSDHEREQRWIDGAAPETFGADGEAVRELVDAVLGLRMVRGAMHLDRADPDELESKEGIYLASAVMDFVRKVYGHDAGAMQELKRAAEKVANEKKPLPK